MSEHEPAPSELAQQLAQATLNYKGPDNGAKAGEINHDTERMTAAIFNAISKIQGRTGDLTCEDVTLLHLIHGFGRCITKIKERGEIPWDKVADHAGWLEVYKSAVKQHHTNPITTRDWRDGYWSLLDLSSADPRRIVLGFDLAYSTQTKGPDACADVPPSGPDSPELGDAMYRKMHDDFGILGC